VNGTDDVYRLILDVQRYDWPETLNNYLSAQYHRLARRLGKLKAAMAVAHSLLVIIYHVLSDKKPYSDLGADYFDKVDKERLTRQALRRLEALGYAVTLTPKQEEMA
jgi:transposase